MLNNDVLVDLLTHNSNINFKRFTRWLGVILFCWVGCAVRPVYAQTIDDLYRKASGICDFENNTSEYEHFSTGLMAKNSSGQVFFFLPWREKRPALLKGLGAQSYDQIESYIANLTHFKIDTDSFPRKNPIPLLIEFERSNISIDTYRNLSSCISKSVSEDFSIQQEDKKDVISITKEKKGLMKGITTGVIIGRGDDIIERQFIKITPDQSMASNSMYKTYKDILEGLYFSHNGSVYRLYSSDWRPDVYHMKRFHPEAGSGADFGGEFLGKAEINEVWNGLPVRAKEALNDLVIIPKIDVAQKAKSVKKIPPPRKIVKKPPPPPAKPEIMDDNVANYHAYPSELVGSDVQAIGSSSTYSMKLDPTDGGKDLAGKLPQEKDDIQYTWTRYNVTNLVKQGQTINPNDPKWLDENPLSGEEDISKWAGQWRDVARRLGDVMEDAVDVRLDSVGQSDNFNQANKMYIEEIRTKALEPRFQEALKNNGQGQAFLEKMQDPSIDVAMSGAIEMDMILNQLLPSQNPSNNAKSMPIEYVYKIFTKLKKYGFFIEKVKYAPIRALVALGGSGVSAVGRMISDTPSEREIPWDQAGYFLVRCIATPKIKDGRKRASSVAVKLIEVRSTGYLALNVLNQPHAQLDELNLAYMLESDPQKKEALGKLIADFVQLHQSDAIGFLNKILDHKKKERSLQSCITQFAMPAILPSVGSSPNPASPSEKPSLDCQQAANLDKEIEKLNEQLSLAKKRYEKYASLGSQDNSKLYLKPEASFASEVTGVAYPLTLQLFEQKPENGFIHWVLSDVSTRDGKVYDGYGRNNAQAIWNAMYNLSSDNEYGRGTIAIRLPDKNQLPDINRRSAMFRSAPRGLALVMEHLNDLTIVLTVLSFFVPGAGTAAMLVGALIAAKRMITRFSQGTLRLDATTVGDLIALVGAVGTGVAKIGQLRLNRLGKQFFIAKEGGDLAKLNQLAAKLENVTAFYQGAVAANEFINTGGLIFGNIELAVTMAEIAKDEMSGNLTHSDARRKMVAVLIEAIPNNAFYIHGLVENAKQHHLVASTDAASPIKRTPPPLEFRELDFRAGITEKLPEIERFQRIKDYLGSDFMSQHPEATSTQKIFEITQGHGSSLGSKVERLEKTVQLKKGEPWRDESLRGIKLENTEGIQVHQSGDSPVYQTTIKPVVQGQAGAKLTFSIEAVPFFSSEGPHGEDSGHARYSLERNNGAWSARISIHEMVSPESARHLIGHELNEITRIIEKFPNADRKTINEQAQAGVFSRGERVGVLTCHDEATVRQLFDYYRKLADMSVERTNKRSKRNQLISEKNQIPGDESDHRKQTIQQAIDSLTGEINQLSNNINSVEIPRAKRLLKAMGVDGESIASARKDRLETLMELLNAHMSDRLLSTNPDSPEFDNLREQARFIKEQVGDARIASEIDSYRHRADGLVPGNSEEQIALIRHLIYPKVESNFPTRGAIGGHLESELMHYQRGNPSIFFKQIDSWVMGNATVKQFEQYRYKDPGRVPAAAERPGGLQFKPEDWLRTENLNLAGVSEPVVKTTVDRLSFLLDRAIPAYEHWLNTEAVKRIPTSPPAEGRAHHTISTGPIQNIHGDVFEAFVTYRPTPDGSFRWVLETIYPLKPQSAQSNGARTELMRKYFLLQFQKIALHSKRSFRRALSRTSSG